MSGPLPAGTTLLLVDLQRAIEHPKWGRLSNLAVAGAAGRLLAAFRTARRPVVHVAHHSREPESPYRPDQPGAAFKEEVAPAAGEPVVVKRVHSAFVGTDLAERLKGSGAETLVIGGVLTHNSVEATIRHASDLGFTVIVAPEATSAAEKRDLAGRLWTAEEVQALSLANLAGEYAMILPLARLLERLS